MVGRERLGVVGKVLLKEPGLRKTEGMEMRMTDLSGNKICKRISSRKNSKKGFTLVELLVVLVILAIIAAVAIPAMLGFTDDSREKQYITEAKEALTATQAMISDAYTDNLVYISTSMRDKALETSGLDGSNTEFVVWTESSFKKADGTYDTYKSYAIASALYVVNGNTFVFYDNGKWVVSDDFSVIGGKGKQGVAYSRGAACYDESSNYITIWPSNSESANKDSAINKKYADGSDELIDDDENKRHDDSKNYDTEKPSGDKAGITVYINAPKTIKNYVPLTVSGGERFSVALTSSGFKEEVPISAPDNIHYIGDSLRWTVNGQEFTSMQNVEQYLIDTYPDADDVKESISVSVSGSIKERVIPVSIGFVPCDDSTQSVTLNGNSASTIKMQYHMAYEEISEMIYSTTGEEFIPSHIAVSSIGSNAEHIKFAGEWAVKGTDGNYIMSGTNHVMTISSQIKAEVESLTKNYVDNNESSIGVAIEGSQTTVLENTGFTFVAPADIYKKVYVRGVLNNEKNDYLGEVKFGSEKVNTFSEIFACNELTNKVYKATGDENSLSKGTEVADSNGTVVDNYSIFNGHEIYIEDVKYTPENIYKKAKRVKFWNLYDCDFSYYITDDLSNLEQNREQYNCTEEIIAKLYNESNDSFGEVAEVDMTDMTTKLKNNASGITPINEIFANLADGAANINKIEYVNGTEAPAPGSVFKEIGISETTVKAGEGDKLARENGKYVTDVIRDPEYPAYTVAYSKQSSVSGKYDIFVITEDCTNIKVDGSLKQMNSGFTNMVSNDVIGKFETSGVTDMSDMFKNCSSVARLNLAGLNTSSVTSMQGLFYNCSAAESIVVSGFNTSQVTDMSYMFYNCKNIETLDLSDFNASNVSTMMSMFEMVEMTYSDQNKGIISDSDKTHHNKLTSILFGTNLSVSSNLRTVEKMFKNCDSLTGLDLRGFGICSHLETINSWFSGCKSLTYIDLGNFETSSDYLENIDRSFYYVGRFTGDTIEADQGCRVFAKAKWQCKNTISAKNPYVGTSDYTFDYFRINMYGKLYKNSNTINIKESNVNVTYYKGGSEHLDIQDVGDIPITTQGGGKRLYKGYFMSSSSEYYLNGTWRD